MIFQPSFCKLATLAMLCIWATGLMSCTSSEPEEAGADDVLADLDIVGSDTPATDKGPTPPPDGWAVCTPGEFKHCTLDYRGEIICNSTGDGWDSHPCKSSDGSSSICHTDAPGCLECVPGQRRCKNDDELEVCNEEGKAYIPDVKCNTEINGQVCSQSDKGAACVRL